MDLIGRGPNGRLDSLAACMLLWSGAMSFCLDSITWDGTAHHIGAPTIHDDIIGMHRVRHDDVEAIVPEVLEIMKALDADKSLRVPEAQIAEALRCALPESDLTGMGLFLLQGGTHPLVVEPVDNATIRIRYDERLARGIPNLQHLLCRFALRLRSLRGNEGDFTVLFCKRDATQAVAEIPDFEGAVEGASTKLDACVHVKGEQGTTGSTNQESNYLRAICQLEEVAYTIHKLIVSANRRKRELEEACAKTEKDMPSPEDEQFQTKKASARGLTDSPKAARSLAIRAVFYLAFGVLLFAAGSQIAMGPGKLLPQVMAPVEEAIRAIMKAVGLSSEEVPQIDAAGAMAVLGVPQGSITNACRIVGLLLMSFAILIPAWRIIRHKRRLDRELERNYAQRALLTALVEKHNNHVYISYNMALEQWAADLEGITRQKGLVQETLKMLDDAQVTVGNALSKRYEAGPIPPTLRNMSAACTMADYLVTGQCDSIAGKDGAAARFQRECAESKASTNPQKALATQPTLRAATRSAEQLVQSIDAEPSEERRQVRIASYLNHIDALAD